MWERVFPAETPIDEVDPALLSRLSVAGAGIRNVALSAAFIAAAEDGEVSMARLEQAARDEFFKLDRTISKAEIRGWT